MSKMRKFFKSKKAFTLVELIAVLVIMAIAASIVMPNIQGVISNTEYRKNITNCLTATTFVRSYVDLLNLGENYAYYEKNGKTYSIYIQGSPSGLQFALNQYNLDVNYQYYVVPYETSAQSTNPTATIQDAIATVVRGRTSFVIAHRLSTITGADMILAVRDGRIVERGTHQELMHARGYYYRLCRRQIEGII